MIGSLLALVKYKDIDPRWALIGLEKPPSRTKEGASGGIGQAGSEGKHIPGRGKSIGKGPEMGGGHWY